MPSPKYGCPGKIAIPNAMQPGLLGRPSRRGSYSHLTLDFDSHEPWLRSWLAVLPHVDLASADGPDREQDGLGCPRSAICGCFCSTLEKAILFFFAAPSATAPVSARLRKEQPRGPIVSRVCLDWAVLQRDLTIYLLYHLHSRTPGVTGTPQWSRSDKYRERAQDFHRLLGVIAMSSLLEPRLVAISFFSLWTSPSRLVPLPFSLLPCGTSVP
ncbi:hypothetical protein N7468_001127 [Penicillium chermesinum]|uniref:Uncharacterized protein n=1 Tax=Penicillium chermesinum TaxID=63820 RepID=A0A9W9TYB7_9EURO|nr:uncharacterized protein N7468_001127 [Penicillium chermesinum]KAJ5246144.1 hypothetical protein N7468_001127 [Penicillium chermesinum]